MAEWICQTVNAKVNCTCAYAKEKTVELFVLDQFISNEYNLYVLALVGSAGL